MIKSKIVSRFYGASLAGLILSLTLFPQFASAVTLTQSRSIDSNSEIVNQSPLSVSGTTATRSYNLSGNETTIFSQFDPGLGTLTSVNISLVGSGLNQVSVDSNNTLLVDGSNSLSVSAGVGFDSGSNAFMSTSPGDNFSDPFAGNLGISLAAGDASSFIGTGTFNVDFVNDTLMQLTFGPCDDLSSIFGIGFCPPDSIDSEFNGDFQVEYEFVPDAAHDGSWTQTRNVEVTSSDPLVQAGNLPNTREYELNSSETNTFSQFDPALGELTGVEILFLGDGLIESLGEPTFTEFMTGEATSEVTLAAAGFDQSETYRLLWDTPGIQLQHLFDVGLLLSLDDSQLANFIGTEGLDVSIDLHTLLMLSFGSCVDPSGIAGICIPEVLENLDGEISLIYHFNQGTSPIPLPASLWLFGSALIGLAGFSKRRNST